MRELAAMLALALGTSVAWSVPPLPAPLNSSRQQIENWTFEDVQMFVHGSMGAEFVPESVLRAFIDIYPELFPTKDLTHFGLIADRQFGWPIGFSRGSAAHLGQQTSLGLNCASCHSAQMRSAKSRKQVFVIGVTSHFDSEAFFASVIAASYQTAAPANMRKFLAAYVARDGFNEAWDQQSAKIEAAIKADPIGARGAGAGGFQEIPAESLEVKGKVQEVDLAALAMTMLKLFHNMRAALHAPDVPMKELPPASGPGRNDAFGLLSAVLFNAPQPYGPVKYGVVWNLKDRRWVHWDGNTRSPIGRNILASVGLGAPLIENRAVLDLPLVQRQTDLSEQIVAPKYPLEIDRVAAQRGAAIYSKTCESCHDGPESDKRLTSADEVGTDPIRAKVFTQQQADRFNGFFKRVKIDGFAVPVEPPIRSTQKYWSANLAGVWARAPYLHNGSVRTMRELLTPAAKRAASFRRGSRDYDEETMGYTDSGRYVLETHSAGNSNSGHEYGTDLSDDQRRDLIEFLKTK